MTQHFYHSVLKYRHNQASGEVLNLGVLFIFPEAGQVHFSAPENLRRLERAFPKSEVKTLKGYLKSFEAQAKKLSKKCIGNYDDFNQLVQDWFLTLNGSALYFEKATKAPIWKGILETERAFSHRFLAAYEIIGLENKIRRRNEAYILEKVKNLLSEKLPHQQLNAFIVEEETVVKNQWAHLHSDWHWKNDTQNLVKPVSFDLKSRERIEDKALALAKKLDLLGGVLQDNNQRVDILITRPQSEQLLPVYKNSEQILKDAKAPHQVIEESAFSKYVGEVVQTKFS